MSDAQRIEFGDFQTPVELAEQCCHVIRRHFQNPTTLIEPTCGRGAFLVAAGVEFPRARLIGYEINDRYRRDARAGLQSMPNDRWQISKRDFFQCDWSADREKYSGSVLYFGNPPWVTNSALGVLGGLNLPPKSNVNSDRGFDALTGQSNFDIAESMLTSLLLAMKPDRDALAMLIKTSTARRAVQQAWRNNRRFSHISIRRFDAKKHFGVNVDACLLIYKPTDDKNATQICCQSPSMTAATDGVAFGWHDNQVVANPVAAQTTAHLSSSGANQGEELTWRSGVKHDLAQVLELNLVAGRIENRGNQIIEIESDLLYPLAKGSDVANGRTDCRDRRVLITQRAMNESTNALAITHPGAWRYLQENAGRFAARKSSIYRDRDRFALFGIGPYTFAPWKVAICGLYKRLSFTIFRPIDGRPVVLDDTCYFLPLQSRNQAAFVKQLLESPLATEYFQARVFWDAKRPITAKLLRGLSLESVADQLGLKAEFDRLLAAEKTAF